MLVHLASPAACSFMIHMLDNLRVKVPKIVKQMYGKIASLVLKYYHQLGELVSNACPVDYLSVECGCILRPVVNSELDPLEPRWKQRRFDSCVCPASVEAERHDCNLLVRCESG